MFLRIIAAILIPPLGVALTRGIGRDFWINVILTLLAWLPGAIHAVWIVTQSPEA